MIGSITFSTNEFNLQKGVIMFFIIGGTLISGPFSIPNIHLDDTYIYVTLKSETWVFIGKNFMFEGCYARILIQFVYHQHLYIHFAIEYNESKHEKLSHRAL